MVAHRPGWIWRKLVSMIIACQNYLAPSIKVGQFDLLSYGMRDQKSWNFVKSFLQRFDFKEFSDNYRYREHVLLDDKLRNLLYEGVDSIKRPHEQDRDGMPADIKKLDPVVYDIIRQQITGNPASSPHGIDILIKSGERSFEERLLIYHVATELYCDWKEKQSNEKQRNEIQSEERKLSSPEQGHVSVEDKRFLKASKIPSDYMLYLLVAHPPLLLPVLTPELRSYRETRAASVRFFQHPSNSYEAMRTKTYTIFSQKGDGVKYKNSVVLDGIKVAEYLISKRNDDTGRFLCQLWLEMLCFAASQFVAPQEGQNSNKDSTAVTAREGQNSNEDSTAVTPQEGQNNNEDSTGVAPQEGQNDINEIQIESSIGPVVSIVVQSQ
ncbi:hypothetical protein L6164_025913 [Bauhinia variegata]|uniref:Uncharacterized protein n=1 Tax=Bauhinia variegata TaxID=167791 RepID=A0ACB9M309_BAUVA|nr:hypothetical protein L6164_025913 [Bauhinia variegata]